MAEAHEKQEEEALKIRMVVVAVQKWQQDILEARMLVLDAHEGEHRNPAEGC